MSSSSIQSHSSASQYVTPSTFNSNSLQSFLKQLSKLASSAESQAASAMLEESENLKKELKKAHDEIRDLKERKRVAIEEMFAANEDGKAKQKEALDHIESLRASVKQKDQSLTEYSNQVQALHQQINSLKSSYSLELSKVSQSAKKINELEQSSKEKDKTIDKMKTAGSNLKTMLSSAQQKIQELEAEKTALKKELQASQGRLRNLESFTVQQLELDERSISTKFSELWAFSLSEMFTVLREDLDETVLKDKSIWEKLRKEIARFAVQYFPLVPSNSSEAKGMRLAMILAILSREICKNIFQPDYILPEDSAIHGILSRLAENNTEKESFYRRVLLSIDENAEEEKFSRHAFRRCIERVVQKAAEFWLPIQRAQQRYETEFDLIDLEDDDWEPFCFPGDNTIPARQHQVVQDVNILTVFPCISLVKDGNRDPLTHLTQLRSTQMLFIAAEYEARQMSTSFVVPRRSSTRSRRRSIAQNTDQPNGGSFLEGRSPEP
ncbi:uncharacterized protein N7484_011067 [Penicillium longicatenatum]|uniref:uncharacterized protein n=1 Tax=Penicillium longicatenatum TaxID=1561947 RepID=UPI00254688CC|nr:uncharacterized protein N7484_011067 [Penicillium longicatenatum]KAJ5630967.1 hypothetical protein N7484_011067 [Penicillium longicatenatum]